LREAAEVASRSVSKGFEESRQKTFDEFQEFLGAVGQGKRLETANGLDVVAFVQGYWLPKHREQCRTMLGNEKVASASVVKAVIQHVVKSNSMLGYPDAANPGKAESVKSHREGYRNRLHDQGVREQRAKLVDPSKVTNLIGYLEEQARNQSGIKKCVLLADLAIVQYLWETWSRGKECGEVEARQVNMESGNVTPGWTKTCRSEASGTIMIGKGSCFMEAAGRLIAQMDRQGHPIGIGFLFKPTNRRRDGFVNEPLSSDAMRRRVQKHLKDAGLYAGETLHSFRRSAVQHAADIEGYDIKKLMEFGRWQSYAAFRLYIEEIEHKFMRK
jgi:integrase